MLPHALEGQTLHPKNHTVLEMAAFPPPPVFYPWVWENFEMYPVRKEYRIH